MTYADLGYDIIKRTSIVESQSIKGRGGTRMSVDFQVQLEGGHVLRATRFAAQNGAPEGIIIIAHGYKGFKDWGMFPYAAEYLSRSHEVVTFNFSHNGIGEKDPLEFTELEKFAVNTYDQELSDLFALIRYLQADEQLRVLPLFLIGHSRGAGVCLVHALDHPDTVNGVVSWNGVTNLDLFSDKQKEEMRENGRSYVLNGRTNQQMPLDVVIIEDLERQHERYDIIGRLSHHKDFPVILIQGSEDGAHLRHGSERLTSVRPDIQWVQVPGGNHTFGTVHPFKGPTPQLTEALDATLDFIAHL
ncbi:Alpha/beta hydrolase family protein [compost metagenome]